jgi:hypothetical protein
MGVQVQKQTYKSHGREFDSKAQAAKFDKLMEAKEQYEDAQRAYQRQMAEASKTADGELFEFGVFHDYYAIRGHAWLPYIHSAAFLCWNWAVRDEDGVVSISDEAKGDDKRQWYRIDELYSGKRNAEKALAEAHVKELTELTEAANKLRVSLDLPPLLPPRTK